MAVRTWTGAGLNNNWNNAANWDGGLTFPAGGDDIIFNGAFPITGNKNCTLNVAFGAVNFNFTGYTGTFTFGANLTITSGTLTLGTGTTYATTGTPTSFTLTIAGVAPGIISNNKILPINLLLGMNGGVLTLTGNADFQGNFLTASTGHGIKAATGTTVDLRIGGNISLAAITTNATDHVTIKGYGVSKTYVSNAAAVNGRISFVSGSSYTSLANSSLSGGFFTVESGGQFNAVSTHSFNGTATLSGFNSTNNSIFFGIVGGTTLTLNTDNAVRFITIQTTSISIVSVGSSKLLLEGNFTATGGATTVIDRLEFSGTTLSTVSAVTTASNLRILNISFNKTGAGSVNFTSTEFRLVIPSGLTYTWTHTAGTITYSPTSVIRIQYSGVASTLVYSESISLSTPSTINSLVLTAGILQLNSPLRATTLTPAGTTMTFTGTAGWICGTWLYSVPGGTIILQSGVTYTTTTNVIMLGTDANKILMRSSAPTTSYAIWTLQNPAAQSMVYVSATAIDSSLGMTIYSFGGIISTAAPVPTLNWALGAAQATKAFTFVN
jgi:hypothetical protein